MQTENKIFNITRLPDKTILKIGRKKWGEITYNKNPDYKWMLWINGMALSGYETEEAAIQRAEKMRVDFTEAAKEIYNQFKK